MGALIIGVIAIILAMGTIFGAIMVLRPLGLSIFTATIMSGWPPFLMMIAQGWFYIVLLLMLAVIFVYLKFITKGSNSPGGQV